MPSAFPDCRHAGEVLAPDVRACRSPKLIGLKQVSAAQCRDCYCRDHPLDRQENGAVVPLRLIDCLYLDAVEVDESAMHQGVAKANEPVRCLHPEHDWTTRANCSRCGDYQFPLLSPEMSVADVKRIRRAPPRAQPEGWWRWSNVIRAQRELADECVEAIPPFPQPSVERGIIVVGGGKYFPSAYVTIRVLKHVGTRLPVQLWHLAGEVTDLQRRLMSDLGVECVDADALRAQHPFRFIDGHWWKGWQLKAYALLQCPFREVLLLDADCYPVRDPEVIFEWARYRKTGAVFWPDIESSLVLLTAESVGAFGVAPFEDRPTESGQLLINREQCWRELNQAAHYNAQADFTYQWLWGDKDTYPIAWRRLGTPYSRMFPSSRGTPHGILHFDQHGDVLFQHRCTAKFTLDDEKFDSTPGQAPSDAPCEFLLEGFCREAIRELACQTTARNRPVAAVGADGMSVISVAGRRFHVRAGSRWDREILESVVLRDEYGMRTLAQGGLPVSFVVDVGAHIGGFSRLVKELWPAARILAFEPAADSAGLFERNLDGQQDVHLFRAAAWHGQADQVHLSDAADGNESARFTVEALEDLHAVYCTTDVRAVPAIGLVDALRANRFERVDILKLDCEGSEVLLLQLLQSAGLLQSTRAIRGEWHHRASLEPLQAALSGTHRVTLYDAPGAEWGAFSADLLDQESA